MEKWPLQEAKMPLGKSIITIGSDPRCGIGLKLFPKFRQIVRTEIGENLAVHFDDGGELLAGEVAHFCEGLAVGDDIERFILDAALVEPGDGFLTPGTIRFDEQADFHCLEINPLSAPCNFPA